MESIWKTVLTFAVIILIASMGVSIISANVDITAAGNYMQQVSVVIGESDYSEEIISQCVREAEQNGYVLEVEVYDSPVYAEHKYALVRLKYLYRIPLLGVRQWKVKEKIIV